MVCKSVVWLIGREGCRGSIEKVKVEWERVGWIDMLRLVLGV